MLTPTLKLPTLTQELSLNTARWHRHLGAAETRFTHFVRRMADIGIGLSLAVSIPAQLMVTSFLRSTQELSRAAHLAAVRLDKPSAEIADQIAQIGLSLSRKFPVDSISIVQGMEEIIKTGANLPFAAAAVQDFAKFSIVGATPMEGLVHDVMGIVTSLGMVTGNAQKDLQVIRKVQGSIAILADQTIADYKTLVEGIASAAPIIKALNISFEEGAAIIAAYHQALVEGTTSGTKMNMMLRNLETIVRKNKEAWVTFFGKEQIAFDEFGRLRPVADWLDDLLMRLVRLTPEAAAFQMHLLGFRAKDKHATTVLFGLTNEIRRLQQSLQQAGGYISDRFNVVMKDATRQFDILRNRFFAMKYQMGMALLPTMQVLIAIFGALADKFAGLSFASKKQVAGWILLISVVGPVLIILSILARSIGLVIRFVLMLGVSLIRLPIVWIIMPIMRLVATFLALGAQMGYVSAALSLLGSAFQRVASTGIVQAIWAFHMSLWRMSGTINSVAVRALTSLRNEIKLLSLSYKQAGGGGAGIAEMFRTIHYQGLTKLSKVFKRMGLEHAHQYIEGYLKVYRKYGRIGPALLTNPTIKALHATTMAWFNHIKSFVTTSGIIPQSVRGILTSVWNLGKGYLNVATSWVSSSRIMTLATSTLSTSLKVLNGLLSITIALLRTVGRMLIYMFFIEVIMWIYDWIKGLFTGAKDQMNDLMDQAKQQIKDLNAQIGDIDQTLKDLVSGDSEGVLAQLGIKMPSQKQMDEAQKLWDLVYGDRPKHISVEHVQQQVENAVRKGIISGMEASMMKQFLVAPSGMTPGANLRFGTDVLPEEPVPEEEMEETQAEAMIHPFEAKELGSAEEFQARIRSQQQLETIASRQLQEQKKTNQQVASVNKNTETIAQTLKSAPVLQPANLA